MRGSSCSTYPVSAPHRNPEKTTPFRRDRTRNAHLFKRRNPRNPAGTGITWSGIRHLLQCLHCRPAHPDLDSLQKYALRRRETRVEKSTSERKHHLHHSRSSTVHLPNPAPLRSPGRPEHDEQHDRSTRHASGRNGHRRSPTENCIHQKKNLPFRRTAPVHLPGVCFGIDESNPDIRQHTGF